MLRFCTYNNKKEKRYHYSKKSGANYDCGVHPLCNRSHTLSFFNYYYCSSLTSNTVILPAFNTLLNEAIQDIAANFLFGLIRLNYLSRSHFNISVFRIAFRCIRVSFFDFATVPFGLPHPIHYSKSMSSTAACGETVAKSKNFTYLNTGDTEAEIFNNKVRNKL